MTAQTVRYDLHSHLVPGVDDGVRDLDEALGGIALLTGLGYHGAVLTPHIYPEVFDNSESFLTERFAVLQEQVRKHFPVFRLQLGAEYLLEERLFERLCHHSDTLLCFGADRRYLLVEFPMLVMPTVVGQCLEVCQRQGIRLVIAHVERYLYVQQDPRGQRLADWRSRGALLQVNLGSVVGQYGQVVRRTARALWRQGWVDIVGTDLHRVGDGYALYPKAWQYLGHRPGRFDPRWHHSLFG